MTPSPKHIEKARRLASQLGFEPDANYPEDHEVQVVLIATALAEAEAAGIERAAKECDRLAAIPWYAGALPRDYAERVRALKDQL